MNLEQYKNKTWILHLIGAATNFSTVCLVRTKNKNEIVKQIYRIWDSCFWSPKLFSSDNEGEFSNDIFYQINETLNTKMRTTTRESSFSNVIVVRHSKVLFDAFSKTLNDVMCEPEIALAWAVSVENALVSFWSHCEYSFSKITNAWRFKPIPH